MTDDSADARTPGQGAAPSAVRSLLARVSQWARARSRVGLAVIGAVPGSSAALFMDPMQLPLGFATDAATPRQADVLVVVGAVSHKLAPFLVRLHAAMAQPAAVLAIDLAPPHTKPHYPLVARIVDIVPVDVWLTGPLPTAEDLAAAVAALDAPRRRT